MTTSIFSFLSTSETAASSPRSARWSGTDGGNRRAVAVDQAVEDDGPVAGSGKLPNAMTSDITRSADDKKRSWVGTFYCVPRADG